MWIGFTGPSSGFQQGGTSSLKTQSGGLCGLDRVAAPRAETRLAQGQEPEQLQVHNGRKSPRKLVQASKGGFSICLFLWAIQLPNYTIQVVPETVSNHVFAKWRRHTWGSLIRVGLPGERQCFYPISSSLRGPERAEGEAWTRGACW